MAEPGPMGICVHTFRVVPAKDDNGNDGYTAKWVLSNRQRSGLMGKKPQACPVRPTRALVLQTMATLYADIAEFGKETPDDRSYR